MNIIGHRGAAGLALENTLTAFEIAQKLKVYAIELDVRKTKDNHLVVIHDNDLQRVADKNIKIKDLSLSELKKIKLMDGISTVPSLEEVIIQTGNTRLMIEIKESGCTELLTKIISKYPQKDITVISFKLDELQSIKQQLPNVQIYINEHTSPVEIIHLARTYKFYGIGLNFWLLNPLTYWLAKRSGLQILLYTINSRFIYKIIRILYPRVNICTDYPSRFLSSRKKASIN